MPEGKLEGHPGDVIKSREVVSPLFPTASVRQIMYQSTDIHGNPIPVTGALLVPRGPSQGPRPLIALNAGHPWARQTLRAVAVFDPATADPRAIDGASGALTSRLSNSPAWSVQWLSQRLNGYPALNGCSEVGVKLL